MLYSRNRTRDPGRCVFDKNFVAQNMVIMNTKEATAHFCLEVLKTQKLILLTTCQIRSLPVNGLFLKNRWFNKELSFFVNPVKSVISLFLIRFKFTSQKIAGQRTHMRFLLASKMKFIKRNSENERRIKL